MNKGKKVIIKVPLDGVLITKKLSRQLFGAVRPTSVHKPKKGGGYSRRQKHKDRASNSEALLLFWKLC